MEESFERTAWNARYEQHHHIWSTEPDPLLVECVESLEPSTAIDLGAGEGRHALWLAQHGWNVTAVDVSDIALQRLAERAGESQVSIRTLALRFKEYFALGEKAGLVVAANIHPEVHQRAAFFNHVIDCVALDGYLFVIGHHRDSLGMAGPPDPDRLFTEEILREGFAPLEILRCDVIRGVSDLPGHEEAPSVAIWARNRTS